MPMEALLAAYIVAFAIVHSYTASLGFKKLAYRYVSEGVYRFLYSAFSAITALPLAGLWLYYRWDSPLVYAVPHPYRLVSFAVMASGAAIAMVSLAQTDPLEFLGVKAVLEMDQKKEKRLITSGVYGFVRHPLYLGGMLFFWGNPVMTLMDLAGSAFVSAYLILGSRLEEGKLLEEFGEEYEEYQSRVSAFLPVEWMKNKLGLR